MKGSVKVAVIGGVPIRLHWSLVILVLFAVGPGITASEALDEAAWIVAVFACVLAHELAHSFVARHRGYVVRDVVLMPLGGFSEIVGIANSPADETAISLVGPLLNVAIAAILAIVAASSGLALWPPTLFARAWVVRIVWANVFLGGLNLVPALPLDGGRALRGLLSRSRDRAQATAMAARISTSIAVVMIGVGILVDFWIALLGVLVLLGARAEQRSAAAGELLHGLKVKDAMVSDAWGLEAGKAVEDAAPLLREFPNRAFLVVEAGAVIGIVSESDLLAHPHSSTVRDATDTVAMLLDADDDLYPTAVDAFAESGRKALAVGEGGRPAGVLYVSALESQLRERQAHVAR